MLDILDIITVTGIDPITIRQAWHRARYSCSLARGEVEMWEIEECIDSIWWTGDSTCCLRDGSLSLTYCTGHPEYSELWCDAECTGTTQKPWRNILEGYGNHPECDGNVWRPTEATSIVHCPGSVNLYSYPCHHMRPHDLWCQRWMMTITHMTSTYICEFWMLPPPSLMFCMMHYIRMDDISIMLF